jgi:hypothetical protein
MRRPRRRGPVRRPAPGLPWPLIEVRADDALSTHRDERAAAAAHAQSDSSRLVVRNISSRRAGSCAVGGSTVIGSAGEQVGERLVLPLVGRDDRVTERQAAIVGKHDESHDGTLIGVASYQVLASLGLGPLSRLQRQGLPDPSPRAPISRGTRTGSPSSQNRGSLQTRAVSHQASSRWLLPGRATAAPGRPEAWLATSASSLAL